MQGPQGLVVIVYVSSAVRTLNAHDLAALVLQARSRNRSHGITGVLLHHDGCFMQAIEGPEVTVSSLFERIQQDQRHRGLIELHRERSDRREFPFWPLVAGPDARTLGLTVGTTGSLASGGSAQRRWRDGVATGFLRTFTGPSDRFSAQLP